MWRYLLVPSMGPVENIELLARSEHRVRILDLLCEHGSLEKHALGSRLDASRTTVGRNLAALEEQGWIRRTNGDCTITRQGELVAKAFDDLVGEVELAAKLQSFMQWVPDGSLDLDLSLLADAEVTLAQPGDPWAMVNRHVNAIEKTSDDRVVLPVTGLHAFEAIHRKIVDGDARAELVAAPSVAETFRTNPDYAPLFEELVATDRFEVRVYDGTVPYYLGVLDSTVQIGVDEEEDPRALLETTNEEVREWALEQYRGYKRRSHEFSLS